jgi:hypothetical protein
MPRRPAKVAQGEILRVIRAAKEAGAAEVVIDSGFATRLFRCYDTKLPASDHGVGIAPGRIACHLASRARRSREGRYRRRGIIGRNPATGFFGMRRDAGATRMANSDQVVNEQVASRQ